MQQRPKARGPTSGREEEEESGRRKEATGGGGGGGLAHVCSTTSQAGTVDAVRSLQLRLAQWRATVASRRTNALGLKQHRAHIASCTNTALPPYPLLTSVRLWLGRTLRAATVTLFPSRTSSSTLQTLVQTKRRKERTSVIDEAGWTRDWDMEL